MKALFHAMQRDEYARQAKIRVRQHEQCTRPSHRRWLRAEIKRLRDREEWHARRVAVVETPEVEALAAKALFYRRRASTHRDQRERECSLREVRHVLRAAGNRLRKHLQSATPSAEDSQTAQGVEGLIGTQPQKGHVSDE
jgi:hypothetical protein